MIKELIPFDLNNMRNYKSQKRDIVCLGRHHFSCTENSSTKVGNYIVLFRTSNGLVLG